MGAVILSAPERSKIAASFLAAARRVCPPGFPAMPPILAAQAILESNYGLQQAAPNNYLGIKARPGEAANKADTTEFLRGKYVKVRAGFRRFRDMDECFTAYVDLITKRLPTVYRAANAAKLDPVAYAKGLQGVYATDPNYAAKVIRVAREHGFIAADGKPARAGLASPLVLLAVAIGGVALLARKA